MDAPFWLALICVVAANGDYQVSMFGFRFEPAQQVVSPDVV